MMKKAVLNFLLMVLSLGVMAQTGTLSGTVVDENTKETIIGATVFVKETAQGTLTDFDGNYTLNVAPGTYTVEIKYISYADFVKEGVTITAGSNTKVDVNMSESTTLLEAVVIKAKRKENTENALVAQQKKADVVQSGVSKQEMQRAASSNAAEGMKKVSGVSIQGGKYAAVRGMDGRYIATAINGVPVPNTDPDRNSTQLDLIPTDVLDNIVITKTFMPDQSGRTTGGGINLKTKDFPSEFYLKFKTSFGINSASFGKDDFLTYEGGKTDWLGYDGGARDPHPNLMDTSLSENFTKGAYIKARGDDEKAGVIDETIKNGNHQMTPTTMATPINRSVGLSFGNQYKIFKEKQKIGYSLNFNLRNRFSYYSDGIYRDFGSVSGGTESTQSNVLINDADLTDSRSVERPSVGGLGILSYEFMEDNSISYVKLYNHSADKMARSIDGFRDALGVEAHFYSHVLGWKEREINYDQIIGSHRLNFLDSTAFHGLEVDWVLANFSFEQNEPDLRQFAYDYGILDSNYYISFANYSRPAHFYRSLKDVEKQGKIDLKLPILKKKGESNFVKVGGAYAAKDRVFSENTFTVYSNPRSLFTDVGGSVDAFFADSSLGWAGQDDRGRNNIKNFYVDETDPLNSYVGRTTNMAQYAMVGLDITKRLRFIGGARYETVGYNLGRDDSTILDTTFSNPLPSMNFIYLLDKEGNKKLRVSATQTVARPTMREISPFSSIQFIGGPFIKGNMDLVNTPVNNLDMRFEWYFKAGEMFSVSAYGKQFTNPIVRKQVLSDNFEMTWVNVEDAYLYGTEFEFKKNLKFIHPIFKNFKLGGNGTYVLSEINAGDTINTGDTRIFPSQSKYLYNLDLSYNNDSLKLMCAITLNHFDDRIAQIGESVNMDIWERGYTNINFVVNKDLGDHFSTKFSVKNILNRKRQMFINYYGTEYITRQNDIGRSYSVGFAYKF